MFALIVSSIIHSRCSICSVSKADGIDNIAFNVTSASGSPNAGLLTVTVASPSDSSPTVRTPGFVDDHSAVTSPPFNAVGTENPPVILDGSVINAFKLSYASCKV